MSEDVLRQLRVTHGHLGGVLRMVEEDAYCPEVLKQLSAVQGSLERAGRLVLRNHLETCVAKAMQEGRTSEIVDELLDALRFQRVTAGAAGEPVSATSLGGDEDREETT